MKIKKNSHIIFKYTKNIGSKILNYNKTLKNTGTMSYNDILIMNCECSDSPFKHDTFGHIITGDLNIIREQELRHLISHGTKYREIPSLNICKTKNGLKTNLETFCTN